MENYGRVDGLVNNAGIEAAAFTAGLAEPDWVLTIAAAISRSELAAAHRHGSRHREGHPDDRHNGEGEADADSVCG